jgi:hypothetical protein
MQNQNRSNNNSNLNKELGALTPNEYAIVSGTLLGDGHLQKKTENTYRLRILHSLKQKDYVWWKYNALKRLCSTTKPPQEVVNNKKYRAVSFYTSSLSLFKDLHGLFYKPVLKKEKITFVKTITPELIDNLPMNPLVVATFYLDDGSVRNDCYAGKIATQGFSKEECELLREYFLKWNIQCNVVIHSLKDPKYSLNVGASTFGNLIEVIEPTVREIPSMVYKLNELRKPRND